MYYRLPGADLLIFFAAARCCTLFEVAHGVWRSLVARFVRDEEVVGSNPATPTQG